MPRELIQAKEAAETSLRQYGAGLSTAEIPSFDWGAVGTRAEELIGGGGGAEFDPESAFLQQARGLIDPSGQEQALLQDLTRIGERETTQMGDILAARGAYRGGSLAAHRGDITERTQAQYRTGVADIRGRAQQTMAQLMGVERGAQLQEQGMEQQRNIQLANLLQNIAGQEAQEGRYQFDVKRDISKELTTATQGRYELERQQRGLGQRFLGWMFGR